MTNRTIRNGRAVRVAFAAAALLALLAPGTAPAQTETGRITGTVLASTGEAVAEAVIVARNQQTGLTRKTKSSKQGTYTIANLKAGPYEVTVEAERMDRAVLQARVVVGSSSRLDFTLYPTQQP